MTFQRERQLWLMYSVDTSDDWFFYVSMENVRHLLHRAYAQAHRIAGIQSSS